MVGSAESSPDRAVPASFLNPAVMMSNRETDTVAYERRSPDTRLSATASANPARVATRAPMTTDPPASMPSERFHWLRSGSRYRGTGLWSTRTTAGLFGVAGFMRDTAPSATSARATTHRARTAVPGVEVARIVNEETMTDHSVPLPPPEMPRASSDDTRRLVIAVPLVTVSWLVMVVILVMATVRISRWELAPGEAMPVSPRISFTKPAGAGGSLPTRYPAENGIRFVTAFGGQLSVLDSVLGWLDPHVQVDTYEEHFGQQTPTVSRHVGFQSMYGAKQVAEYVAMKRLGLDAQFIEGLVAVNELVCSDNPAPKSACKLLEVGDTIVKFDGEATPTLSALAAAMKGHGVGDEVTLTVVPWGEEPDSVSAQEKRTVQLMANPDDNSKAIIGFIPADTRTVKLPFEVAISTTDIGGPSAGLAFTLGLIDDLTKGNLMGKGRVAATGTMAPDESVGAIGALRQKAIAVRDAGATLFLVPAGQSPEEVVAARKAAGPGVKIVQVATLSEALRALVANGGNPLPAK